MSTASVLTHRLQKVGGWSHDGAIGAGIPDISAGGHYDFATVTIPVKGGHYYLLDASLGGYITSATRLTYSIEIEGYIVVAVSTYPLRDSSANAWLLTIPVSMSGIWACNGADRTVTATLRLWARDHYPDWELHTAHHRVTAFDLGPISGGQSGRAATVAHDIPRTLYRTFSQGVTRLNVGPNAESPLFSGQFTPQAGHTYLVEGTISACMDSNGQQSVQHWLQVGGSIIAKANMKMHRGPWTGLTALPTRLTGLWTAPNDQPTTAMWVFKNTLPWNQEVIGDGGTHTFHVVDLG